MTVPELDSALHERFADPAAGSALLERSRGELEIRRAHDDGSDDARSHVGRALQRLSEHCRWAGLLDESLRLKDETILIWRDLGKFRAAYLVRLQRALVLAELGSGAAPAEMESLAEELQDERLAPYYTDFWLEYEARRLLWSGDRVGARERLVEALEFRREHRNARAVARTERALGLIDSAGESV